MIKFISGRQAFCSSRNFFVRESGSNGNENPGSSRIDTELESLVPKGQGFLSNAVQLRVS